MEYEIRQALEDMECTAAGLRWGLHDVDGDSVYVHVNGVFASYIHVRFEDMTWQDHRDRYDEDLQCNLRELTGLLESFLTEMDASEGRQEGERLTMEEVNRLLKTQKERKLVRWQELQHELEEKRHIQKMVDEWGSMSCRLREEHAQRYTMEEIVLDNQLGDEDGITIVMRGSQNHQLKLNWVLLEKEYTDEEEAKDMANMKRLMKLFNNGMLDEEQVEDLFKKWDILKKNIELRVKGKGCQASADGGRSAGQAT